MSAAGWWPPRISCATAPARRSARPTATRARSAGCSTVVLLAAVDELPVPGEPPVEGLAVRRTVGVNGTRLSACLGDGVLGYVVCGRDRWLAQPVLVVLVGMLDQRHGGYLLVLDQIRRPDLNGLGLASCGKDHPFMLEQLLIEVERCAQQ